MNTDIVVIGAGAAGLAAALSACQGGTKITIIEKLAAPGGTSLFAEGLFAVESSLQKHDFVGLTCDDVFKTIMEATQWRANGRLVRTYLEKTADTIEWLKEMGVGFDRVSAMWPNGPRTWHLITGRGGGLVKALTSRVTQSGISIRFQTSLKEILLDDHGRVRAVSVIDGEGKEAEIGARAVIVASGGFMNNSRMLEEYAGAGRNTSAIVDMQQTGEPIEIAWAAGAAAEGTGVLMAAPSVRGEKPGSSLHAASAQPGLCVNLLGERFLDESANFRWTLASNALLKQPEGVMFTIFDEEGKRALMEEGIEVPIGVYRPVMSKLTDLDDEILRGVAKGDVFVADTVEGLARAISADPGTLSETVAEYNRCCDERRDYLFAKEVQYLKPIRTPNFYAFRASVHLLGTLGGLKINHRTEVLNGKFEKITGLYAAGNCAGGVYGTNYELTVPGEALGFAVNSGRMAGESALQFLGK